MRKKHLSLEEAKKLLPVVKKKMLELKKLDGAIELLDNFGIIFEDEFLMMKQEIMENQKFHKMNVELYKVLSDLVESGVVVKDIKIGLVDFYSTHEGKEIFLCYKMGEEGIQHWHETDCGFEERKPISLLTSKISKK